MWSELIVGSTPLIRNTKKKKERNENEKRDEGMEEEEGRIGNKLEKNKRMERKEIQKNINE